MKSGKPVDHPGGGVRPNSDGPSVGRDGEDVGRSPQRRNGDPSRVGTKGDVLAIKNERQFRRISSFR